MNKLQSQLFFFQINNDWLKFILKHENILIEYSLLMPRVLAIMNVKEISIFLKKFHRKDEIINKLYSFCELLQTVCKNIKHARYEHLIKKNL